MKNGNYLKEEIISGKDIRKFDCVIQKLVLVSKQVPS